MPAEDGILTGQGADLLAKTGPGTLAGDVMRQYWVPALLVSDLPTSGGRAVRVRLLTERLVAFRTGSGQVGLLAEPCSHAGSSLAFGKVEKDGVRCGTHGWKYDLSGSCVDIPAESPESKLKQLFRQRVCRCVERGGIVWAYLGPLREPPELEEPEWATLPASQYQVSRQSDRRSYLQVRDSHVPPSQLAYLRDALQSQRPHALDGNGYGWVEPFRVPFHIIRPADAYAAFRAQVWVPADDDNTVYWSITCSLTGTWRDGACTLDDQDSPCSAISRGGDGPLNDGGPTRDTPIVEGERAGSARGHGNGKRGVKESYVHLASGNLVDD